MESIGTTDKARRYWITPDLILKPALPERIDLSEGARQLSAIGHLAHLAVRSG